jgi:hypothetical protein
MSNRNPTLVKWLCLNRLPIWLFHDFSGRMNSRIIAKLCTYVCKILDLMLGHNLGLLIPFTAKRFGVLPLIIIHSGRWIMSDKTALIGTHYANLELHVQKRLKKRFLDFCILKNKNRRARVDGLAVGVSWAWRRCAGEGCVRGTKGGGDMAKSYFMVCSIFWHHLRAEEKSRCVWITRHRENHFETVRCCEETPQNK